MSKNKIKIQKTKAPKAPKVKRIREKKKHPLFAFLSLVALAAVLMGILSLFIANAIIKGAVDDKIYTLETFQKTDAYDCIIVLGCGVKPDGSPSDMLYDRIKTACMLYHNGKAKKILFSGDHGRLEYDEVNTMKRVASEEFSVPLDDIFLDHAGFSTAETMARAAEIFGVKKAIVVTQDYHLYRALMLAEDYGISADGVSASLRRYAGQTYRDLREVAARLKDALFTTDYVGGEKIDITGSGTVTHD